MKKHFTPKLLALAIFFSSSTFSQSNTFPSSGNVGIGTTSPASTLHIVPASVGDGGIKYNNSFNGYSSMLWASNNVGFGMVSGGGLCAVANGGYGLTISTSASNSSAGAMLNVKGSGATSSTYSLKVQNSSATDLLNIRDDGNVGIGTNSPAATLHIVPASVGDGGLKFNNSFNGYSSITWASNNVGLGMLSGGGLCAVANSGYGFTISTTASNSSAGAMLNVRGAGASSSTYALKVQNSSEANLFSVRDDGNVGIATTSPSEKLDVNGNVKATGFLLPTGAGAGKILTSDASGNASWQTPGASSGWAFNGSTVSSLKTFGTIDNYDLPIITNNTERMRILANGNVGIGTTSPGTLLSVNGTATVGNAGGGYHLIINDIPTARWAIGTGGFGLHIANDYTSSWVDRLYIDHLGNVGIGTTSLPASDAKLAVNGFIYSKKVKVTQIGWADYVFHSNYRLRPLSEVEQYIQEHHHLPEVPSASEVEKDGVDLGDNQATLLKKIEELTLYLIEQNKKLEALEKELKQLRMSR